VVGTVALVHQHDLSLPERLSHALRSRAVYPSLYPWLIALALLDVLLTMIILCLGGEEANALPRAVFAQAGVPGLVALKAASIGFTLAICQYVGRRRFRAGHLLTQFAVAANTAAVTMGIAALAVYAAVVAAG
jgi:hypothetical protein